jgi:hypothetical protein
LLIDGMQSTVYTQWHPGFNITYLNMEMVGLWNWDIPRCIFSLVITLSHYGHALIITLCSYNTYASDIIGSICHKVDNKGHEYVNNLNFASQYPFKHQSKRQKHKYSCYISLYFYFLTYTIITYISNAFLHISTYNY